MHSDHSASKPRHERRCTRVWIDRSSDDQALCLRYANTCRLNREVACGTAGRFDDRVVLVKRAAELRNAEEQHRKRYEHDRELDCDDSCLASARHHCTRVATGGPFVSAPPGRPVVMHGLPGSLVSPRYSIFASEGVPIGFRRRTHAQSRIWTVWLPCQSAQRKMGTTLSLRSAPYV